MKVKKMITEIQKRQATMLYKFSSFDYLHGLKIKLDHLQKFVENILIQSKIQKRDLFLQDEKWGSRNTSENWSNHAWPFLADFKVSILRDIADRETEIFHVTGTNQFVRGTAEYSTQWMTVDEEKRYELSVDDIVTHAGNIDRTIDKSYREYRWNEFALALRWPDVADQFVQLPKFRIHPDITAKSGEVPPKTGVYMSVDDPYASLQFSWSGSSAGILLDSTTLNELGKAALKTVGHTKMWVDGDAMRKFVIDNQFNPDLASDHYFFEAQTAERAPSLLARHAFTSRPSLWCFVELVEGEYEPSNNDSEKHDQQSARFAAGEICIKKGYYFTPASDSSRRWFESGQAFPEVSSVYGRTIWQWDAQQD